jgi:ABC-type glycerol-3-phosphate transport system substrate-binding protein
MSGQRRPEPVNHRRVRRWSTWTSLIVVLAMVLAACGGTTGEETTTTAAAGATTTAAGSEGTTTTATMSDEPVDLTMWVSREQYIPSDAFWDRFHAKYPNINVTVELQPDDDLFFQLQRMADAGQPLPDLVQLDSYFAAPMYDLGIAIDLTDLVSQWEQEDPEGFAKQPESLFFGYDDAIVGLATTGTMDGLYHRADWLEEAGVGVPIENWDAVLDALRAIKTQHPDVTPWSMIATRGEGVNWLISFMSSAGVEFDGAIPQIDSEAGKYIIEFYQTLVKEDLTTLDALAWGEDEARGAWIGGRAAMMIDGIRSTNDVGGALMEGLGLNPEDWGLMLLPTSLHGGGEDGQQIIATRTFHITSTSEHQYEASLVLREQMQTENALEAAQSGAIYLQKDVLTSDQFAETYPYLTEDVKTAILTATTFPSASYFFEVVDVLEQFVQDVLQNPDTPSDELATKWQAELDAVGG